MYEKLKPYLADDSFFLAVLIMLISIASFGLGRQSVEKMEGGPAPSAPAGVILSQSPKYVENKDSNIVVPEYKVVASKSGTKYHSLTCPGAKQIKEENKVFFNNIKEAEAAGYTPAANCPELGM